MTPRTAIISYATAGFHAGMLRLIDSALEHCPEMDLLMFSPDMPEMEYNGVKIIHEMPTGFKPHGEVPYGFKFYLIGDAYLAGYRKIIWIDTSIRISKNLTPLFDQATGLTVFHNLGHPLKYFISDDAMRLLKVTESDIESIPQIWGGALLFDFDKIPCSVAFQLVAVDMVGGAFQTSGSTRPGFVAHRHDQAVMSVRFHGLSKMEPYGKIASAEHARTGEYGNDVYLIYGK